MNRSQRALLRGFPEPELPAVIHRLTAAGYAVAQTIASCDVLVLGPAATEKHHNLARERKLPAISWAEFAAALASPRGEATPPLHRALFEHIAPGRIRVLDEVLETDLPHVPPEVLSGLCFDEPFLRALRAVVRGAKHSLPTALEGPTAASKTTVVLFLGRLLGRPVARLNLSGQTDAGELIGRFVPLPTGHDWDLASLRACEPHLQPLTRELLQQAQGRELTWAERVLIRRAEGIENHQWRFQEGVLPQAMRHGHFVLLDELNLAEPQNLERVNSLLEQPPSLLVSEGHHTRFGGADGLPIHPQFRIFGSMNGSEYAGRSLMSPAFRDRWTNYYQADSPGEREYLAHLRLLVFGEQPVVQLGGWRYQAPAPAPMFPRLADAHGIEVLLERLARFHTLLSAEDASGGGLGRNRRERYVFSRRGLHTCLRLWAASLEDAGGGVTAETLLARTVSAVYFERLAAVDRKAARSVATAAGLPLEP